MSPTCHASEIFALYIAFAVPLFSRQTVPVDLMCLRLMCGSFHRGTTWPPFRTEASKPVSLRTSRLVEVQVGTWFIPHTPRTEGECINGAPF